MIHHQNADAMVLASARLRGILPPDIRHFAYYQGGECLSNAHWLGPWRQHLMTNYGLRQNHRKIIGKTKKSAFCVPYSVTIPSKFIRHVVISSITHEQLKTIYIPENNTTSLILSHQRLVFTVCHTCSRASIKLIMGIWYKLSDDRR
jgi:hypothetical protein